ncbi:hypothetical protein ACOSP7_018043 [Xanthoceras sorbifolium]
MSSESSSNSSEGSTFRSSLKSASSESKSIGSGDNPIESRNHPRSAGGPESSLPPSIIQGYNSEDYHRNNLEFSRFAVNRIRENRINNSRLSIYREEFSIPSDVGLRIPNMGEQVSNPEPGCVAIHPAFLEIGMCLPLQPYVRRFLREVGLVPAQLSPNSWRILIGMWCLWRFNGIDTDPTLSEIKHCYKLVGHAHGGDGWWHLSSWTRLSGHSLIIGQPSSNKEWKKTWFVATTGWGRELTIGGREQRVRSVFGFPGIWECVHEKDLTAEEREHINSAWETRSDHRHIDYLLDVRVLASVNIIPEPSSLRLANSKRSFGKKKKLAGKSDKRKMPDKEVTPSRKGKSVASKRPRRTLPKGSLGAKIPEEFIKRVSSKLARVTTETSDQVLPEQEVLGDADPSSAMPPVPPRGGKSKAGSTESVRGGDKRRRSRSPSAFHRPPMGSGVPPTFTSTRPSVSQSSVDAIFSPDQSVDFICDNARNFMRSIDPGATGKMSNDDRIRIATGQFYTAIGNFRHQEMRLVELHDQLKHTEAELIHKKDLLSCTQRDLGESRKEVAHLKARVASLEKKAARGAKADEYRGRLKDARRLITHLQNELPDRAIDRFVKSSEYMKAVNDEFQRGSLDTQYLVSKVDPNFDFEKFEEIKAAEWGNGETAEKADSPKEEEDSLLVADVELSGEEVEEVGSGGEATDHIDSEGPPDNFDQRLIPEVRWVGHSDLFDRRLVSHDLLVVSIGGWSQRLVPQDFVIFSIGVLDHFVRGFYLSVGYQCQHNFFDLRIPGLWRYNAPCKPLNFLRRPRTSQLLNRLYLIWVGIDSTMVNHEAKEFSRTYSKGAFLWVELHLVSSESCRKYTPPCFSRFVLRTCDSPISGMLLLRSLYRKASPCNNTSPCHLSNWATLAFSNIWSIGNFSGVYLSNLLLGILVSPSLWPTLARSSFSGALAFPLLNLLYHDALDIHRYHVINLQTNKLEGDTDWMVGINPPTIKLESNHFL